MFTVDKMIGGVSFVHDSSLSSRPMCRHLFCGSDSSQSASSSYNLFDNVYNTRDILRFQL